MIAHGAIVLALPLAWELLLAVPLSLLLAASLVHDALPGWAREIDLDGEAASLVLLVATVAAVVAGAIWLGGAT